MRHRNHPEFAVIAKNNHLGFCATGGETEGVVSVGEFIGCVFHVGLFAEKADELRQFCVRLLDILDLTFANQARYVDKVIHFYGKSLKYCEAAAHRLNFLRILVWGGFGLLFICAHDYTLALNMRKAKPSTWRGFSENFAKVFTYSVHNLVR